MMVHLWPKAAVIGGVTGRPAQFQPSANDRFVLARLRTILFTALLTLTGLCNAAWGNETLLGRWTGSFDCNAGPRVDLELNISSIDEGRLSGELQFKANGRTASFNVAGTATAAGTFELKPGTWIKQPPRFKATGMQGTLFRFGNKDGIKGTLMPLCKRGGFIAYRKILAPQRPKPPPLPVVGERDADKLTAIIRSAIQTLVDRRETDKDAWSRLEHSINASRADKATELALRAEVKEAYGNVVGDALLQELAATPTNFPEGVQGAVRLVRRALRADLPKSTMQRITVACRTHVAAILGKEFAQIASQIANLPETLDSLIQIRVALAPVETFRGAVEQEFGAFDPNWILKPVLRRMAELESSPAVAAELRAALTDVRQSPKPRQATAALLLGVLGQDEAGSPLAAIAAEGRELAAIAEIVVEDQSSGQHDKLEPSADDIALFAYSRARPINKIMASLRCKKGPIDADPLTIAKCLLGESELRVFRTVKTGCVAETPGLQYVCEFRQDVRLVVAETGKPLPIQSIFGLILGLSLDDYTGLMAKARFVRSGPGANEWTVSWGNLSVRIPLVFDVAAQRGMKESAVVLPLNKQKISPLHWRNIEGRCAPENTEATAGGCEKVFDLVKSKAFKILTCSYGPSEKDGTGFETYHFWSERVPDNIASFATNDDEHPFGSLGQRALTNCPGDTRELELAYRDTRL